MANPYTRKEVTQIKNDFKQRIDDFKPERRRQLITQAAKLRDFKLESTKRTKTALLEQRRTAKEQSLQSKLQKFEWRMNKPVTFTQDLRAVFKSWTVTSVSLGFLKVISYRIEKHKVNTKAELQTPFKTPPRTSVQCG